MTPAIRNADAATHGTGLGKAFHITTTAAVAAYDIYPYGGGQSALTSATLLLPSTSWDTNYIAVDAYGSGPGAGGVVQIVGQQDGTTVTISPANDIAAGNGVAAAKKGQPTTYTVNRGQVLQFTQDASLAGSAILSDKAIGLWGGKSGLAIDTCCNDSAHQQIPPVRALGSEYVGVRYRNRYDGIEETPPWRIIGAVDGTTLTYEPAAPAGAPTTLALGQVTEFRSGGPCVVKSQDAQHPFYMAGYMTGAGQYDPAENGGSGKPDGRGDAEFVNVIPLGEFSDAYTFYTDPTYPETNLVLVRSKVDGAFADVTLDCAGNLTGWAPIGTGGNFEYTRIDLVRHNFQPVGNCNNGRHEIHSKKPFGLTVWGWAFAESFRERKSANGCGQMPVLTAHAVTKAYGLKPLFDQATFTIRRGEKVALLGPNGTGKSTLLRVLAGLEPLDSGSIDRRRDASILYLPQEPQLDPTRTPREIAREGLAQWHAAKSRYDEVSRRIDEGETDDALLEEQASIAEDVERLGGWSRDHEVDEVLLHLGVRDVERPVGTMSGGEKRRVALARILVAKPDLAIFDEPTNHLDADTITWLEDFLVAEFPGAVLLVTHDRYLLDKVAQRVFDLEDGKVAEYTKRNDHVGAFEDFIEQKAERFAQAERVESNRQNFLRKEIEWLRRGPKARSTKQKARIQRAETAVGAEGLRIRGEVELVGLEAGSSRLGGNILEVLGVGLELGGRRLIDDLTMRLVKGDRVGIVGPNGIGKTTLLKLITGELTPNQGKVVRGVQTKFAYFDQARTTLRDDWTVLDNVTEREHSDKTGAGTVNIGDRVMEMRAYLELFLFEGASLRRKVSALSGGERARVALALALKTGANVLLLDEPTNDLDIATLGSLAELIESWPGCVLVVSHDRFFLDRVVTSILAFEGEGKITQYAGNWENYREQKREGERAAKAELKRASAPPPPLPKAPPSPAAADPRRRKPTRTRGAP